jgi:hypothetical protein
MAARYNAYGSLPVADDTDIAAMASRIESIFLIGSPELVAVGSQWYADRHQQLQDLSLMTCVPTNVLAYVCSALSPQTGWKDNWHALMQTLNGWIHEDKAPVRTATLYAANDSKAWRILSAWDDGLSMDTIREILGKGPKTQSFARNLIECATLADGCTQAVTVDSITYQAATGFVIQALAFVARKYGIPLFIFQAILWTIYRQTGA